jgi:hypothetical protein
MFEDLKDPNFSIGFDPSKKSAPIEPVESGSGDSWIKENWRVILAVSQLLLLALVIGGGVYFFKQKSIAKKNQEKNSQVVIDDEGGKTLPNNFLPDLPNNPSNNASSTGDVKGETVSFGSFYKYDYPSLPYKGKEVALPLVIKNDVVNYYEVSRKINLDKYIATINKSGFAMVDNQFPAGKDFYTSYASLAEKSLPQLLTTDFLLYYQQNKFKEIYDDIKANAFYKDLWQINKQFFDIANARYKQTKLKLGDVSSPVMEAQRLEAAFFAVTLELLKPQKDQINNQKGYNALKFTPKEASDFEFELPAYLGDDVTKEVAMIRFGNRVAKSPVMLYTRDYKIYESAHAMADAKLKNYYLANRWFNSLFPIYGNGENCPDCLLDSNDWLINFITAQYIAEDFTKNQELKNIWAKVYKINSYFSGLRHDLTYLHYVKEVVDAYGEDYDLSEIFSENFDFQKKLDIARSLRDKILANNTFEPIEGGLDRGNPANLPDIGMKLLQDDFWPDDYMMTRLVEPNVTVYNGPSNLKSGKEKVANVTSCEGRKIGTYTRCRPFGLDVVHFFAPVDSKYYTENIAYENYDSEISAINDRFQYFTNDTWHSNVYWNLFNVVDKSLAKEQKLRGPINIATDDWRNRTANTALGAWVNLRLPTDRIVGAWQGTKTGALADNGAADVFVEPNLRLINDLISNTKMLEDILYALKIVKDVDYSAKRLAEYNDELLKIKKLIEKELAGEKLSDTDQVFVSEILRKKIEPVKDYKRSFSVKYGKASINESIDGIRWVVAVYQNGDKKILVVGPIFNYQEAGKTRIFND